jgi:hypothetical protein
LGKVSLFRTDKCEEPQIALHEILHALGFDHNDNPDSIMYPYTSCAQEFDTYISDELDRLYSVPSRPDLVMKSATAKKVGRYLDFEARVTNFGLRNVKNATLFILTDGKKQAEFNLGEIEIGTEKILNVENTRVPRRFDKLIFQVGSSEVEISMENNKLEVEVV